MIRAHLDAMDTNENLFVVELPTALIVRNKELRTNMLVSSTVCMETILTITEWI